LGVSLEGVLVAVAGFVSTLASNGSSVTLPALDLLGLPEHVANGTNRLSVVTLGLASEREAREMDGIGREYWGKGVATRVLSTFMCHVETWRSMLRRGQGVLQRAAKRSRNLFRR
jgi:hypothetical protein